VKTLALFTWAQVGTFACLAYLAFPDAGALQIAWLRLLLSGISDVVFVWLLLRIFAPLRWMDMLRGVVRPLTAAGVMFVGLQAINSYWIHPVLSLALLTKMLIGALLYTTSVGLLWCAAGCPAGAESYILNYCIGPLKRKLQ
jgi:polyferredoxin